jgi:predicted transcriptional regulator
MPEEYVTISIRIPKKLVSELSVVAKSMNRSRNYILHRIIDIYLKTEKSNFE